MNANPKSTVYAFDLGQFPYTISNAALMRQFFPDRFFIIYGASQSSFPGFVERAEPGFRCDVFSIDGDHSTNGTFQDLKNFRSIASCRNWVVMDDAGWSSTNKAWQQAKDEGILTQVECFVDLAPTPEFQFMEFPDNRSWCLGFFNVDDDDCPKWFKESPNTDVTRIRPIEAWSWKTSCWIQRQHLWWESASWALMMGKCKFLLSSFFFFPSSFFFLLCSFFFLLSSCFFLSYAGWALMTETPLNSADTRRKFEDLTNF